MEKLISTKQSDKKGLFATAEKVFSKSLVKMIQDQGNGFLEEKREGSFVYDEGGNFYLDCYTSAGIYNLGRKNDAIAACFKKAVFETDQGNFVMPSEEKALLAQKISLFMPGNLDCVLFGVTRGESMEAAAKLSRGFTQRSEIVTVDGGCYGETGFALTLSERKGKEQFGELIPDVKTVPFGDAQAARSAVTNRTAAFVIEPIQAENHCRTADSGYYSLLRSLCNENGAKLIFDETQSGFGRTGRTFFFEHMDVIPDILIVGEAITGGLFPMTAAVFTPELKGFFDIHPLIHLCTFGGHDLGCRVAMAALNEYERLEPWENAQANGLELMKALTGSADKRKGLAISVSGKGLLISMQFPTREASRMFCIRARENGLLLKTGMVDETCVLLRPSLLVTQEEISCIIDGINKSLDMI